MTKWLWSFIVIVPFVGFTGCGGGAPPEEPAVPVSDTEMDEMKDIGSVPTPGEG